MKYMQIPFGRLAALVGGIAIIVSCDTTPTTGRFGSGASGGPTGTTPIGPPTGADLTAPFVRIDNPLPGQLVNVGDSLLVEVFFQDDRKLGSLTITGFKETGDINLGTFERTVRYTSPPAPPPQQPFLPGQTTATIRRFLKPVVPVDTTLGPLLIMAIGVDSAGNVDTAQVTVSLVTGPRVITFNPVNGDSVPRGIGMRVADSAIASSGVSRITVRVQGEATWPTPLDQTITRTYPAGTTIAVFDESVLIPADAPLRGRITITATAFDANSNPGTAPPITVFVRAPGTLPPRVFQTVPGRLEISDSITISATGDGITAVGYVVRDSLGAELRRFTQPLSGPPFSSNVVMRLPINLDLPHQGQRVNIISFATDNNTPPGIGFSIPTGTSTPITVEGAAFADTSLITFGRTFRVPRAGGVVSDLAVDEQRGNIFLSNTQFNLLEMWSNTSKTFATNGVQVGALPWGLFVSNNPDTLYVGNSGSTTISRVCINPAICVGGAPAENLAGRFRTRNTIIYQVVFTRDPLTDKIRLTREADVSYSDRPQYIAQSQEGKIFFSTRPTFAATPGTLRYFDPEFQFADTRQIWQYGLRNEGQTIKYAIFNADSIRIGATPPASFVSDTLFIFDHVRNQLAPDFVVNDSMPLAAGTKNRLGGGDVEVVLGLDVATLALTDTTFVAASGDRRWLGFGEGNTGGTGRIMMVKDTLPDPDLEPDFLSPNITVADIVHNAAERVFGIALDSTGLQMTAHGFQTYVAAVDHPFHLRLDGVYDSFDNGAGVAYHPRAKSTTTASPADRVLFTATLNGVIEIVDVAHYNNRGRLITKNNLYGALRVTGPIPGDNVSLTCPADPNCVIVKVYGLTTGGLIVIDLRASDIKP
jgi:hypothetical protein